MTGGHAKRQGSYLNNDGFRAGLKMKRLHKIKSIEAHWSITGFTEDIDRAGNTRTKLCSPGCQARKERKKITVVAKCSSLIALPTRSAPHVFGRHDGLTEGCTVHRASAGDDFRLVRVGLKGRSVVAHLHLENSRCSSTRARSHQVDTIDPL